MNDPAELLDDQTTIHRIRDELIAHLDRHRQSCDKEPCLEVANLLAYLAHCIGASDSDLRHFARLLVNYEVLCQNSPCDIHKDNQ